MRAGRSLRPAIAGALVVALALAPIEASGQSPQEQAQAKLIWRKGKQLVAAGKVEEAADAFRQANQVHEKPQYQLDLARALAQVGSLVEAVELFNTVALTSVPNSDLAIAAAKKHLEELEPRLPWVQIVVKGPAADDVVTTIDGQRVHAAGEIPFDPGRYMVRAEAEGYEAEEREVNLQPGVHDTLTFELQPLAEEAPAPDVAVEDDGASSPIPAIVAFGVGAAGLGVGAVFGILAFKETSDVTERCDGNVCPPEEEAALDQAKTKGHVSTAGFVVGGVGIATGVILLLASGDDDPSGETDAGLRPVVGPGYLGVSGAF